MATGRRNHSGVLVPVLLYGRQQRVVRLPGLHVHTRPSRHSHVRLQKNFTVLVLFLHVWQLFIGAFNSRCCFFPSIPLKMLCQNMKRQIVSRAFYGCKYLFTHTATGRVSLSLSFVSLSWYLMLSTEYNHTSFQYFPYIAHSRNNKTFGHIQSKSHFRSHQSDSVSNKNVWWLKKKKKMLAVYRNDISGLLKYCVRILIVFSCRISLKNFLIMLLKLRLISGFLSRTSGKSLQLFSA